MCDTVWVPTAGGSLFAKNSDRPVAEAQVVEVLPGRPAGGRVRAQYLELDDTGAAVVLGSRPTWLWGLEHGVNEHRVAIGNEEVWTLDDPSAAPAALIGMDLVRLGLERARTAEQAVDVIGELLDRHGQGGPAEGPDGKGYWSSFLLADPRGAWVLETSGSAWVAQPAEAGAGTAISNRLSVGADWSRGSVAVTGDRFDDRRDPAWQPVADVRLACTLPAVADPAAVRGPADLAALLRHHGDRPWGRPGDDPAAVSSLPDPRILPDGTGVTVCMHVRDYQATAASMIASLPADPGEPRRAWVALGSPCASVYVPVFPDADGGVPAALAAPATWERFRRLRDHVESVPDGLVSVRAVLAPVEADLWAEADEVGEVDAEAAAAFAERAWARVDAALRDLGA